MDSVDRKICGIIQTDGKISSAEIAQAVGVSVSTANDRVRRLVSAGIIVEWRGVLDPVLVGAGLCGFIMIDMAYAGEAEACASLKAQAEVLELHHISGPHSYLMKVRVQNTQGLQRFLQDKVKPLTAVQKTETIMTLDTLKETTAVHIPSLSVES